MEELIKTFHIDYKLLIAQAINFTLVLLVLYKFAYKPILKVLNERTDKIEKGLEDAENAAKKLEETEIKEKEVLVEAKKEAQKILSEAQACGKKSQEEMIVEAKEKIEKAVDEAKVKIEDEKSKMIQEAKSEVATLVVSATEKIINEKIDVVKDKELINEVIK